MKTVPISELPTDERPRERCLREGAHVLSLRECVAVILGTGPRGIGCLGLADRVIRPRGFPEGDERLLEAAFFHLLELGPAAGSVLQSIPGMGEAGSARLLAAFELARRYARLREGRTNVEIPNPYESIDHQVLRALDRVPMRERSALREWLGFIPRNDQGVWGNLCVIERGVRTHVNSDPQALFLALLSMRARAFILVHNHPSGSLEPSHADRCLTDQVIAAAQGLGLDCLGHAVVSSLGSRWVVGYSKQE